MKEIYIYVEMSLITITKQKAFYKVHGVLTASTLGWFGIPSSSKSRFVRILHYDPFILGGPTWHDS